LLSLLHRQSAGPVAFFGVAAVLILHPLLLRR